MRSLRPRAQLAAAAAALLCAGSAMSHDTWLTPEADTARGERVLALSTGAQFPLRESALSMAQLAGQRCLAPALSAGTNGSADIWPLRWLADAPDALWLRTTRPVPPTRLLDCQVQTRPMAIALDAAQVSAYFAELRPDAAVRERWARQQATGTAWQEVFHKHARALLGNAAVSGPLQLPAAMPLDATLLLPRWPLEAGDTVSLQLLADGRPLPHHALELRGDVLPLGLWQRTDAAGRLSLRLPRAGRWLLRGVQLLPAADGGAGWESRFFSLHLDVVAVR